MKYVNGQMRDWYVFLLVEMWLELEDKSGGSLVVSKDAQYGQPNPRI
jgi:hypothetical protein